MVLEDWAPTKSTNFMFNQGKSGEMNEFSLKIRKTWEVKALHTQPHIQLSMTIAKFTPLRIIFA